MTAENPYETPQGMDPSGAPPKDQVRTWRRIAIGGLAALAVVQVTGAVLIVPHFQRAGTTGVGLFDEQQVAGIDLAITIGETITAAVAGIGIVGWVIAWIAAKRGSSRKDRSSH